MGDISTVNNEEKKLGWMYRDSSQIVDREEYLLGRKVDKQLEQSILPPDKDQDCFPSSIFNSLPAESQVDVVRKLQEDPLYLIKKKEIESREQFLKNPRKLKQLQEMIKRQQAATEKLKRKVMKKEKKKRSKDLDVLLAKKCKQLLGGFDANKLAALESSSENSSSDTEPGTSKRSMNKKDSRNLDKLLATKYKKILGNINAKKLAEMSSNSESESSIKDEKLKKKRRSLSSSSDDESSVRPAKEMKRKETERRKSSTRADKIRSSIKSKAIRKEVNDRKDSFEEEQERDRRKLYSNREKQKTRDSSESEISTDNKSNVRKITPKKSKSKQNHSSENSNRGHYNEKYSKIKESRIENDSCEERYVKNKTISREGETLKKKKPKAKHHDSSSSSESDARQNKKPFRKGDKIKEKKHKTKLDNRASFSFDSSYLPIKKCRKIEKVKQVNHEVKYENSTSSSTEVSSSEEKDRQKKQYGLVLPSNYKAKEKLKEEVKPLSRDDTCKKPQMKEQKRKLTNEEKELKLKEMISNAKWRDDLRDKSIKTYKEKEKMEKDDYVYKEDFMRNQLAFAMSQGTVESRVKANINSIQRSGQAMSEHFARRK